MTTSTTLRSHVSVLATIGLLLCTASSQAARIPLFERLKARQADLFVMKTTTGAPSINRTPVDIQPSTDAIALPVEDPSIEIISNPAGGSVLKGGAGIASLMVSPPEHDKQAVVVATAVPIIATAATAATAYGYSSAATVATTAAPATSTYAPSSYGSPSSNSGSYGSSPSNSYGSASPSGMGSSSYGSSPSSSSSSSYGSSYGSNSYAKPATTTVKSVSYYNSPSGSSSYGGYGSSSSSGSGSSSMTGTSSSSSSNTVLGVPYGYYTQVQYLPYAPLASQQLTNPIVFSPYLPVPNYILNNFGLPSVSGR